MSDVTITKLDNGPLMVKGGIKLMDAEGNEYPVKETIYLCRCGKSTKPPFCSGAHKTTGYEESSRAN